MAEPRPTSEAPAAPEQRLGAEVARRILRRRLAEREAHRSIWSSLGLFGIVGWSVFREPPPANDAGAVEDVQVARDVRLRQADLSLAVMNRANFSGADLRDVNAYGGVFGGASFAGANLTNATFVGTFLEGAGFRGANLSGANFSGAEMARATGLTQAQLDRACGDQATVLPRGLRIPACR